MKGLAGLFGAKQPAVDTSGIKRQQALADTQEQRLKQQEADAATKEEERRRKESASNRAKRGRSGGSSLLSGLETGIAPVADTRRKTLG